MEVNNNCTIRKANQKDVVPIYELIKELAQYEKASEQVTVTLSEMLDAGFGEHPVWEAIVVEDNGKIVGVSLFYIRYSTWKGSRLYLEDLIVTESYRGKGLGRLLMDETIAISKKRGYHGVCWQVLDWNEPAIHFYEKYNATFDKEWWNVSIEP